MAIMVLVPTAKMMAMENSTLVKGTASYTADMAYSLTLLATNKPSTMEYRENTIRDETVAAVKWRNWESKLRSLSILDNVPFCIFFVKRIGFYSNEKNTFCQICFLLKK